MNFNQIKAPEHLKNKTISIIKAQQNGKNSKKRGILMKVILIAACIPMALALTAFGYNLFSGIDGDEVSLNASYQGDGIVEIEVQNLAKKNLQFDKTIKLEQWSTSEEIFEIKQDMPIIEQGKSKVITIQVPKQYIQRLETPLPDTDWYHFLLTTNKFMFGQTWTASLIFADPIISDKEDLSENSPLPIEDNTKEEDVSEIKNNFKFQNPLKKMEITFDYNDYIDDGEYVHAGLCLKADRGTSIYSFSEGTVIETGFAADLGNYITIDHGNGLKSQYEHCTEILKKQNDNVSMGDVIATVGATGKATGPNLGFSITLNDVPVNPKTILLD
ncbi:MAG: M23 family metallopeptidase [Oscillospiraceae bacterium]